MAPILCLQIIDSDGDHVWVPYSECRTNPNIGTVLIHEKPKAPEPVIRESCEYWKIEEPNEVKRGKYFRAYGGKGPMPKTNLTAGEIYEQMKKEQDEQRRKRANWVKGF